MTKFNLSEDGTLPAYSWPGCYPMFYVTRDGLNVCPACANREVDTSQEVIAGDVHWEGPALTCDDCGESIASAYGEPGETTPSA
jgi:hypothetical protein